MDSNGNALGGIRTPQVQVPLATISGIGQPGSRRSMTLAGSPGLSRVPRSAGYSGPLSHSEPTKLAGLYPTHEAFVKRWDAATAADVKEGFLWRPTQLSSTGSRPRRRSGTRESVSPLAEVALQHLPEGLRGRASKNLTFFGTLKRASSARQ